MDISTKSSKT